MLFKLFDFIYVIIFNLMSCCAAEDDSSKGFCCDTHWSVTLVFVIHCKKILSADSYLAVDFSWTTFCGYLLYEGYSRSFRPH